jgi:hypothetical protein
MYRKNNTSAGIPASGTKYQRNNIIEKMDRRPTKIEEISTLEMK